MELSSLMLAVKRVTTLLICSMSEPCEVLLRAAGSEGSAGASLSSGRPAEPARWLSVLMGEGERGRAGAGSCSSASATSYSALGLASGGSGPPPGPAAGQLAPPGAPALVPAPPAPPAPRPRLSVLLGKGLMTAVWLGFSFLLMWMDRRCHRCCPRPLLSFWAHVTDLPLELRREEGRGEVTQRGPHGLPQGRVGKGLGLGRVLLVPSGAKASTGRRGKSSWKWHLLAGFGFCVQVSSLVAGLLLIISTKVVKGDIGKGEGVFLGILQ